MPVAFWKGNNWFDMVTNEGLPEAVKLVESYIQARTAHRVPKLLTQWPLKSGTLAAIKSGTQAELAQLVFRNFGSATLLPLQAPPLE